MFRDRRDAGRRLARALVHLRGTAPVVLALPRGGVPVAFEIARVLDTELDLLLARKIGVPGQEELALGAVVDGAHPQLVLNEEVLTMLEPPPGYIKAAQERELAEIERRRKLYLEGRPPLETSGRTVIVVDDGIATGATVKAALRGVRRNRPSRLILAVPVAPQSSIDELASECDEIVSLETPDPFYAVGLHYADFAQTTDDEVIQLLAGANRSRRNESRRPPTPP
jgi:putative phosphoribosyl transferase